MFKLKTTTHLSTEEFSWLVKQLQDLWKTKWNVELPSPQDNNLLTYIDENF